MTQDHDPGWEAYQARVEQIEQRTPELLRRRDELIKEIAEVFKDVTREGGVSISEAYAIDYYEPKEVQAAKRASDTDNHWSELDPGKQDPGGSALSFMDPIGTRYYIPACMTYVLKHCNRLGNQHSVGWNGFERVTYKAVSAMDPYDSLRDHTRHKLHLLNREQRVTIAKYLALLAETDFEDPADECNALALGWIAFLPAAETQSLIDHVPRFKNWPDDYDDDP